MTDVPDRFCIPGDYVCNPAVPTVAPDSGDYWDDDRIDTSLNYQFAIYHWAARLIAEHGFASVADIGCGVGTKLVELHRRHPQTEIWGFDRRPAIEICRRRHGFGNWREADLEQPMTFRERKFDLAIASDVIEHLENPDLLLQFLESVVASSGYILLSTPERLRLRGRACRHSPNRCHVREWSREELASFLAGRGFRIVEHRCLPAFRALGNLRFFRRALRRWLRGKSIRYNQAVLMQCTGRSDG